MGFLSFLDAFRSRPQANEHATTSSRRPQRNDVSASSRRRHGDTKSQPTNPDSFTALPHDSNASPKERGRSRGASLSRRRSWFGGRPDADEDVPAVPAIVRTDYNTTANIQRPTVGKALESNSYAQLPSDKRGRRTSTFSSRQDLTTIGALPPLPPMPAESTQAPSPDEQRRSRRASMKSHHRSSSVVSTRSTKRRSFWASSNPDDSEEDIPPVPALVRGGTPDSIPNDPFDDVQPADKARTSNESGDKKTRPVSTVSRKSYVPRSAAAGFLKSTNGASESQRKSYRRSFNLGDNVALVCVTDEHRVEWEKLMNKSAKLDDSVFASTGRDSDEMREGNRFSNAQALAALEFGVRT